MKLGLAHEIGFALAVTASMVIVLLGGELPVFAWLACLAPWLSMLLALKRVSPPASSATLVGIAGVGFGVVTLVRGGIETSVLAGAEVLMSLLVARLLVRRTPAHDLQAVSLSVLLVLAGSVLNVKIGYIAVFVVYSVSAVWALSTRQLIAGAQSEAFSVRARADVVTPAFFLATGAIAVAVLASAALVFAAFPRVGFGDIGAFLRKETRLPESVGLRGDPRLGGGSAVVARARGVPRDAFDRGLYLRGAVYDTITLDGFSQSTRVEERRPGLVQLADAPATARYELTVMPVVGDTLLTLGGVTAVRTLGGGNANPNVTLGIVGRSPLDELKAFGPLVSAMRYDVAGGIAAPGYVPRHAHHTPKELAGPERARWLQLPRGFDATLQKLADDVVAGAPTPRQKATALRHFFWREFVYSQEPPRFAASPLRTFLLDERHAHCEYFAAAYALLLRAEGIPARVVGGFQGGAWDDGVVVFAERNAHAWVEWWDDDAGWIVDDATPLATSPREELAGVASLVERIRRLWDDQVLDYSLQDQTDALARVRRAWRAAGPDGKLLLAALIAPFVVAAVALAIRRRRRARPVVHPLARAILDEVARASHAAVPASATVREAVERAAVDEPLAHALRDALALYEGERFGGAAPTPREVRRHIAALRSARLRTSPPAR